ETDVEIAAAQPRRAQLLVDDLAHARSLLHQDDRLARQLLEGDRAPGEAMATRHGEHDLVAKERLEADAAVAARGADDAELDLAARHLLDHALRVGDRQHDVDTGMALLELGERDREHRSPG